MEAHGGAYKVCELLNRFSSKDVEVESYRLGWICGVPREESLGVGEEQEKMYGISGISDQEYWSMPDELQYME